MNWQHGGPWDARPFNDVFVVQGAGYDGGSLIDANVQIRPPADVLDGGWPSGYSRATLDPYYDLVARQKTQSIGRGMFSARTTRTRTPGSSNRTKASPSP